MVTTLSLPFLVPHINFVARCGPDEAAPLLGDERVGGGMRRLSEFEWYSPCDGGGTYTGETDCGLIKK